MILYALVVAGIGVFGWVITSPIVGELEKIVSSLEVIMSLLQDIKEEGEEG